MGVLQYTVLRSVTGFGLSGCYSYHFDICFVLINTCALFHTTPIHFMNGL